MPDAPAQVDACRWGWGSSTWTSTQTIKLEPNYTGADPEGQSGHGPIHFGNGLCPPPRRKFV